MSINKKITRGEAEELWLETSGKIKQYKLAELAGVHPNTIGNWKLQDDWEKKLKSYIPKRKVGGQQGNKNAKGHGAPLGNTSAETHGAYSTVRLENLPEEERKHIESLDILNHENVLGEYNRELQLLYAKESDLARRIRELEDESATILDRKTVVTGDSDTTSKIYVSRFRYLQILTHEHDKIHGRIIRHLDAIRAYHVDYQRLALDERKHNLNTQRVSGVIRIDPETEEILDIDVEI